MITPVDINLVDFAEVWQLTMEQTQSFAESILETLANKFYDDWRLMAAKELHSSRNEYMRSIYIESISKTDIIVGLRGQLPNMIEQGAAAFDMKPGFSSSLKRKTKKDGGWYMTVPMRWATPGAIAESAIFSNTMPKKIHTIVKKQGMTTNKNLPKQFQNLGQRVEIMDNKGTTLFGQYDHKTSIYEGITKQQPTDDNKHNSYVSFRRVSDMSDPNSWIHTGIVAHNLAQKTLEGLQIEAIVAREKIRFFEDVLK